MKEKRLFLQWSVMASLIVVGAVFAHRFGWFDLLSEGDATMLSFVTIAIFAVSSLWCGLLTWRLDAVRAAGPVDKDGASGQALRRIKIRLGHGHHAVNACVELGLLGTVFGLYMMLNADAPPADGTEAAKAFVAQIKSGMATAFLTTIVGGICGILLGLQVHVLEHAAEETGS